VSDWRITPREHAYAYQVALFHAAALDGVHTAEQHKANIAKCNAAFLEESGAYPSLAARMAGLMLIHPARFERDA